MEKLFLFMGCSEYQVPILRIAKETGLKLICVDKNGVPELREEIDYVIKKDLTDSSKVAEKLKKLPFKNIIGFYGVADYAYDSLFKVFKILKINRFKILLSKKLTDKSNTNSILKKHKIRFPKTVEVKCENEKIQTNKIEYPCIIKKSLSHNSLGIIEISSTKQLMNLLHNSKPKDKFLLQEKINGNVFNVDLIIMKNQIIEHAFTKRYFSNDFKATYAIEYKNNNKFKKYFKHAKDICKKIGIGEGPVTFDFILGNGELYLLEISQHFHSIYLNKLSGKTEQIKQWFFSYTKKQIQKKTNFKFSYHVAYINIYLHSKKVLIKNINFIKNLESFVEFKERKFVNVNNFGSLFGMLFLKNKNLICLRNDINLINNLKLN